MASDAFTGLGSMAGKHRSCIALLDADLGSDGTGGAGVHSRCRWRG